jgi:serine/threonine protein kinase
MAVRIETNAEPIPGYKLIKRLGGGGFGDVWKVEAPGGLHKAIKFVFGDLQDASVDGHRAEQELKAMSRVKTVRHPYILSLERFDIIDGQLLIVMELADRNLWDRFKECRAQGLPGIPRDELLRYMEETAEALDLMNNDYQLQHLDIKPQNIFLVHNHVKVADFGLVKDLEGMAASVTGGVTPVYAAPETFDGWVSRFSDQYSLGIVYQELLTGQRPFSGTNVRQLILQHLQAPPNLSLLPAEDRPAIARALAKKPEERHPTCTDLVKALRSSSSSIPASDQAREQGSSFKPAQPATLSGGEASELSGLKTADMRGAASPSSPTKVGPITPAPAPSPSTFKPMVDQTPLPKAMEPAPVEAAPEIQGDGVLFPALVIGLGTLGLNVLQSLRTLVSEHFGSNEPLANLRYLYIDSDPESSRQATKAPGAIAFSANEVLLARLNRPSHYLKPRDGRTVVDSWIDPQMLYRIPRSQLTTGLRALGRLAFCDSYLAFNKRVRDDLAALTDPESLGNASRQTRLEMRTNRPRIYIVTNLSGGTGSGMYLDVAYASRSILKSMGYADPDVTALLLLPDVGPKSNKSMAVANANAALKELNFFSNGKPFVARYHERESVIQDSRPPFRRCLMLELPDEAKVKETRLITSLAGDFLFRDMFSPLGRAAEKSQSPAGHVRGATFETFGMYRLSSPQGPLVKQAARQLCLHLVQEWITKDATPIEETVRTWVASHWSREEFGAEALIEKLQGACEAALKQAPEELFASMSAHLLTRKGPDIDLNTVDDFLHQLHELIGRPEEETLTSRPIIVEETLTSAADAIVNAWGQKMTEMVVRLIEQPGFRLAGAEEAIRQIVASIEQVLQSYETLATELEKRSQDAFYRIYGILAGLDKKSIAKNRVAAALAELNDLLGKYPKWRYQHLVMRQVTRSYISLRGNFSDELREINFCRNRLGELLKAFEQPVEFETNNASADDSLGGRGKKLFSSECQNLQEAVEQYLRTYSTEQLNDLKNRIQTMIRKHFAGLVNVCMSSANLVKNLEVAMQQETELFVAAGPTGTNVADLFLDQNPDEEQAISEILVSYDEAAPDLTLLDPGALKDMCVVAIPPGESGLRFGELTRRALPDSNLELVASSDDIVFFRQISDLSLGDLKHLGPAGQEAFQELSSVDHVTPHARMDIAFGN